MRYQKWNPNKNYTDIAPDKDRFTYANGVIPSVAVRWHGKKGRDYEGNVLHSNQWKSQVQWSKDGETGWVENENLYVRIK